MPPPVVLIAVVQVRTVPVYGDFVGQSEAKETVNIVPRVTGFLEKIQFKEGSEVRQWRFLERGLWGAGVGAYQREGGAVCEKAPPPVFVRGGRGAA